MSGMKTEQTGFLTVKFYEGSQGIMRDYSCIAYPSQSQNMEGNARSIERHRADLLNNQQLQYE